jgi:hypothetical protein
MLMTFLSSGRTEKLERFRDPLNVLHRNIQFTMEVKRGGHLPFVDMNVYRRPDGSLGHKKTFTHKPLPEPWITYKPFFQPWCTDKESLRDGLEFLKTTFGENGYSIRYDGPLTRRLEPSSRKTSPPRSLSSILCLDELRLAEQLSKRNIKSTGCRLKSPFGEGRPGTEDSGGLHVLYIGQTG